MKHALCPPNFLLSEKESRKLKTLLTALIDRAVLQDYSPEHSIGVDCARYLLSMLEGDAGC
jgi:hypothetical protein